MLYSPAETLVSRTTNVIFSSVTERLIHFQAAKTRMIRREVLRQLIIRENNQNLFNSSNKRHINFAQKF